MLLKKCYKGRIDKRGAIMSTTIKRKSSLEDAWGAIEALVETQQKTEESLRESQKKTEEAQQETQEYLQKLGENLDKANGNFNNKWGHFIDDELKDVIQDCNMNFMLGPGMSAPYLKTLGNIEHLLNALAKKPDISKCKKKIIHTCYLNSADKGSAYRSRSRGL